MYKRNYIKYLILLLGISLSFVANISLANEAYKVAQYSVGERGTASFELFSFYTNSNSTHAKIEYSYGEDEKTYPLKYLGKTKHHGKAAFRVKFSNNYTLLIIPQANLSLKIQDKSKHYSKRFKWMYEGPVNGVGTFCSACAEDKKEAMQIVKKHFL